MCPRSHLRRHLDRLAVVPCLVGLLWLAAPAPGGAWTAAGEEAAAAVAAGAEASRPAVTHRERVEPHEGVDGIYATFRRAYQTLDPRLVGGLYTEDAFYLQPNSDPVEGRGSIERGFTSFFEAVGAADGTLDVTFEILDRQTMGEAVTDVGIFRIVRDGGVRVTRGKFVVVAVPTDGGWKFRLDSFSPMAPDRD